MSATDFIQNQKPERQQILSGIHQIVIETDKNVKSEVGKMMGKQMIIYKTSGVFKYGLSSLKEHMSLHVMPIYGSAALHSRYQKLLFNARFQKGCINLEIVKQLIGDCAKIDLVAIMNEIKKDPGRKYIK